MNTSGFNFGVGIFALLTGAGIFFNPNNDNPWFIGVWIFLSFLGIINIAVTFNNLEVKLKKKVKNGKSKND